MPNAYCLTLRLDVVQTSTVPPYNTHDFGRRSEKRVNTFKRPHHREICMLEYTLGPTEKKPI